MTIVGAMQGPIHHYAYKWMDRVFAVVNLKNVTIKILLDQLIMSPVCILQFIYCCNLLEGENLQKTKHEILTKGIFIYTVCVNFYVNYILFNYTLISGGLDLLAACSILKLLLY